MHCPVVQLVMILQFFVFNYCRLFVALRACRYDMHIGISILRFIIYGRFDTIGRGARGVVPYDATCTKAISSA